MKRKLISLEFLFVSKIKTKKPKTLRAFVKDLNFSLNQNFNLFFEELFGGIEKDDRKFRSRFKKALYWEFQLFTEIYIYRIITAGTAHIKDGKKQAEAAERLLDDISVPDFVGELFDIPSAISAFAKGKYEKVKKILSETEERYRRVSPFDRTIQQQQRLFGKAFELYEKNIKTKKSYSYRASLEEANELFKIIDDNTFDEDFENINRNYTHWRKRKAMGSRSTQLK